MRNIIVLILIALVSLTVIPDQTFAKMKKTTSPVSVAATIKLDLKDRYSGEQIIEKKVPPKNRIPVSMFINALMPGKKIEHLAVKEMVYRPDPKKIPPSSLFFQGLHNAYANHHAFGIRPEVLMYLINSVVAETVKRNPEEYRALFTSSSEKEIIRVRHDGLRKGDPTSPWSAAIGMFDYGLRKKVPGEIMSLMLPKFSTTTRESNVASLIAFMDAASPYYSYKVYTKCGIPRVVLFGKPSDYALVLKSAKALSLRFDKDLKPYFDNLIPVLEEIERASRGIIDQKFWSEIYKYNNASGGPYYGGWISSFVWYISMDDFDAKKIVLVVKPKGLYDWRKIGPFGMKSGSEPSHISSVPFEWIYFNSRLKMEFIGGVLGIDVSNDAITPRLSYGVMDLN